MGGGVISPSCSGLNEYIICMVGFCGYLSVES